MYEIRSFISSDRWVAIPKASITRFTLNERNGDSVKALDIHTLYCTQCVCVCVNKADVTLIQSQSLITFPPGFHPLQIPAIKSSFILCKVSRTAVTRWIRRHKQYDLRYRSTVQSSDAITSFFIKNTVMKFPTRIIKAQSCLPHGVMVRVRTRRFRRRTSYRHPETRMSGVERIRMTLF